MEWTDAFSSLFLRSSPRARSGKMKSLRVASRSKLEARIVALDLAVSHLIEALLRLG